VLKFNPLTGKLDLVSDTSGFVLKSGDTMTGQLVIDAGDDSQAFVLKGADDLDRVVMTSTSNAGGNITVLDSSGNANLTLEGDNGITTPTINGGTLSGDNSGDQDLSGLLVKADNLSDLTSASTARTNLGLGTAAVVADSSLVHIAGTETVTGTKTFSSALTASGGSLTLNNATANRLYYGNVGVAAPATSSNGQKIQLYGTAGTVNATEYAVGIEAGNIWVSSGTGGIKFYRSSGATLAMEMNSSGNFRLGSTATISSKLTFDNHTTAAGGILFGSDVNLYRLTTDHLITDDKLSATGGLARTGLIMSPESGDTSVIPYFQNDLAYNRLRGGATRVYYDGVLQSSTDANTDNLFTPTSTAFAVNTTGITTVVIEIDMCVSLSYTTKIGYAANEVWRARDIIVEAYITATATWSTVGSVTDVAYGEKYFTYSGNPGTISKLRFTFSDFYKAGGAFEIFRIGTIYTLNYASAMGAGFFVTRDAGSIYGDLTMSGTATQVIFPNNSDNTGGLLFGADTNLFRSAANTLKTDDDFECATINTGNGAVELAAGTYTPTGTAVTNITTITPTACQYSRVGNTVTVSGQVAISPTSNNTRTTFALSLPIASNFANSYEAGGGGYTMANATNGHGIAVYADATNNRLEFDYYETHSSPDTFVFNVTYQII